MNPDQTAPPWKQSHLGSYCLQYRLPKSISRREKPTTKVVTGRGRVDIKINKYCSNSFNIIEHLIYLFILEYQRNRFFFLSTSAALKRKPYDGFGDSVNGG